MICSTYFYDISINSLNNPMVIINRINVKKYVSCIDNKTCYDVHCDDKDNCHTKGEHYAIIK